MVVLFCIEITVDCSRFIFSCLFSDCVGTDALVLCWYLGIDIIGYPRMILSDADPWLTYGIGRYLKTDSVSISNQFYNPNLSPGTFLYFLFWFSASVVTFCTFYSAFNLLYSSSTKYFLFRISSSQKKWLFNSSNTKKFSSNYFLL